MEAQMAKILLIDDEDHLRNVLKAVLVRAGHEVTAVASGRAALAANDETFFDVVITDMLTPEMDGVEVLRAFAKGSPRPKIIAITGGSQLLGMDLLSIAPALGADGVLAKPFRAADLPDRVNRVLSGPISDADRRAEGGVARTARLIAR